MRTIDDVYRAVVAARDTVVNARPWYCRDRVLVRHTIADLDRIAARLEPFTSTNGRRE